MPEFNEIIILNVKIWEFGQFYVVPNFFYIKLPNFLLLQNNWFWGL